MTADERSRMLFSGLRDHVAQPDPLAHTHPLAEALRASVEAGSAEHMRELMST